MKLEFKEKRLKKLFNTKTFKELFKTETFRFSFELLDDKNYSIRRNTYIATTVTWTANNILAQFIAKNCNMNKQDCYNTIIYRPEKTNCHLTTKFNAMKRISANM